MTNLHITFPDRLAFTDLETTNSWPPEGEIIELGLVLVEAKTLKVIDRRNWKLRPKHIATANPEVFQYNHYSGEGWIDALPAKEALQQYLTMTAGSAFCSWRVTYDFVFLHDALRTEGLLAPKQFETQICVYSMALQALHQAAITPFKLKTVAAYLSLPLEPEPHQASGGGELAFRVYQKLMVIKS